MINRPAFCAGLVACLAALCLPLSASAQSRDQQSKRPEKAQKQTQEQQTQQQNEKEVPIGWVAVAYDYNSDGEIDGYDYIYYVDLDRARANSHRRMQHARTMSAMRGGMRPFRQRGQEISLHRVEGELTSLKTIKIAGEEQQHLCAKIKTDTGRTARVDLGPQDQLKSLDLQNGDMVTVFGCPGTTNGRQVLMAMDVGSGGKLVEINRPRIDLRRIQGRVANTKVESFEGYNDKFLIAKIRTPRGWTAIVNLGPMSDMQNANIKPGDQISMLVFPSEINGRPGLVAEQVRVHDETFANSTAEDHQMFPRTAQTRMRPGTIRKTSGR